jgi:hypothetical protein
MEISEAIRRLRAQGHDDLAKAVLAAVAEPAPEEEQFMPAAEAAAILELSLNTVKRRVEAGLLGGYKDAHSRYVFVSVSSVKETLATRAALRASAALPGAEPPRIPARRRELAGAHAKK